MLRYLRFVQISKSLNWIMYKCIYFWEKYQLMNSLFFHYSSVTFLIPKYATSEKYASEDFKLWFSDSLSLKDSNLRNYLS